MLNVELITPEAIIFSGKAVSVSIPTGAGEITVLTSHLPLVSTLSPGMMTVRTEGGAEQNFAVARGAVQVEHNTVRVLSDIADRVDSLDESAVEQARARAEKLVREKRDDTEAFTEAVAILDRELARLRSVRRRRSSRSML